MKDFVICQICDLIICSLKQLRVRDCLRDTCNRCKHETLCLSKLLNNIITNEIFDINTKSVSKIDGQKLMD